MTRGKGRPDAFSPQRMYSRHGRPESQDPSFGISALPSPDLEGLAIMCLVWSGGRCSALSEVGCWRSSLGSPQNHYFTLSLLFSPAEQMPLGTLHPDSGEWRGLRAGPSAPCSRLLATPRPVPGCLYVTALLRAVRSCLTDFVLNLVCVCVCVCVCV
jgi:hypothetical protein